MSLASLKGSPYTGLKGSPYTALKGSPYTGLKRLALHRPEKARPTP